MNILRRGLNVGSAETHKNQANNSDSQNKQQTSSLMPSLTTSTSTTTTSGTTTNNNSAHTNSSATSKNTFLQPYKEEFEGENSSLIQSLMSVDDVIGLPPPAVVKAERKTKPLKGHEDKIVQLRSNSTRTDGDENIDDWVITPSFVNTSKQNQVKMLEKLTHASESIRLQGCNELKVTITYDEVFGIKIIPELLSIFSQYTNLISLSCLELLKLILKICQKSHKAVTMEYVFHFYSCLKILAKRNELLNWNENSSKGSEKKEQLANALTWKLSQLIKLFEPNSVDDDLWQMAADVMVELSCQLSKLFNPVNNDFSSTFALKGPSDENSNVKNPDQATLSSLDCFSMKNIMYKHKNRFTEHHVKTLLRKYYIFDELYHPAEQVEFLIELYFSMYPNVFTSYLCDLLDNGSDGMINHVQFISFLSRFSLILAKQANHSGHPASNNSSSPITNSMLMKLMKLYSDKSSTCNGYCVDLFLSLLVVLTLYHSTASAFDQIQPLNDAFELTSKKTPEKLKQKFIYLLGITGHELYKGEKKEQIEYIFSLLLSTEFDYSKKLALEFLKSIRNIVECYRSTAHVQKIKQRIQSYLNISDPDLRRESLEIMNLLESEKTISEDEIDDIDEMNKANAIGESVQILELQGTIDKHNLKMAEQQLEIAKLQQQVSMLQQQVQMLLRNISKSSKPQPTHQETTENNND